MQNEDVIEDPLERLRGKLYANLRKKGSFLIVQCKIHTIFQHLLTDIRVIGITSQEIGQLPSQVTTPL